jgi:hypothetical protein
MSASMQIEPFLEGDFYYFVKEGVRNAYIKSSYKKANRNA